MKSVFVIIFLIPFLCFSQTKISGKIMYENEPVAFANVTLSDQNGQIVKGMVTNEKGEFGFDIKNGNYKLIINHLNFESYTKEILVENDQVLGTIFLVKKLINLNEVVVVGSKKMITRKIDRIIVNIEDSPIATGGNAFDVLKTSPGLVLKNDEISMLGKSGVKVMVNGTMIQLSGEDLKVFLNSIPASGIKEIEIITNPPAGFEAEGNSGIVNIVFKKSKKNSWSDNISLSHTQAKLGRESFNNNFSYQKDKVTLSLNTGYNIGNTYYDQRSEVFYTKNTVKLNDIQNVNEKSLFTRFLFEYAFNEKTKLGVQYLGIFIKKDQQDDIITKYFNNSNGIDFYLKANGEFNLKNNNHSLNLFFDKKIDTLGRKMILNFDVLNYNSRSGNDIFSEKYSSNDRYLNLDFINTSHTDQDIINYSAKIDFEHPLKFAKLAYGGKISFSDTKYIVNNLNLVTDGVALESLQFNEFAYNENIQSAYISGSKKINNKWQTQLGVRSEYTQTKGESKQLNQTNRRDYINFFPTFNLSYKKNAANSFIFSYGRRIQRPDYRLLNPSPLYINSKVSSKGNPDLKPAINDNLEITHVYKDNLTSKISLNIRSNAFTYIFILDDITQQQLVTNDNIYNNYGYAITENYQLSITPWWKTDNTLFLNYSMSKKTNNNVNVVIKNGFEFYGAINNFITLNKSKSIVGEVNFWYNSPYNDNLYKYSAASSTNLAVTFKSLFKNFKLSAGVYDVFNSSPRKMFSEVNNIKQNFISYPSNRYFRISLVYNFGNNEISSREKSFGNEDERKRSN